MESKNNQYLTFQVIMWHRHGMYGMLSALVSLRGIPSLVVGARRAVVLVRTLL